MNAHNIRLRLKESDRTYTITMHLEILAQLPELAARRFAGASYFIVADSNVRRLYGEALLEKFTQRGMNACMLDFPAGEQSKNFKTIPLMPASGSAYLTEPVYAYCAGKCQEKKQGGCFF